MTTKILFIKLRQRLNLTQKEMAELLGKKQSRISEYERGKIKITLDNFFECCDKLKVDPKSLF